MAKRVFWRLLRRMRVLMINTVCGTGSTGRICTDIAKGLKTNGDECLICYGRGEGLGYDNTYKIGTKLSFYLHALKTRVFDKHGLGSARDTKRLIKKIKEYNPDIIHLHNIHGYYVNYKVLFEFLADYNKPIVWTLHDCWAFTGHCSHFDYVACDLWQHDCNKCNYKKGYPASRFLSCAKSNFAQKRYSFTLPKNMVIVTPSNWLKGLVEKTFLKKYEIRVIHNGIDTTVFQRVESDIKQRLGIENKKMIIAVANVWGRRKGIDDILKLAGFLNDGEIIVLVGKLQKPIEHGKIIHIERTFDVNELVKLYSAADVCINPTYEDNYPTVNLEAQACGTPVITYATGGSIESVPQRNIVNKGDVQGLYDAMKSRDTQIIVSFDAQSMIDKYVMIYSGRQ